MVVAAGARGSRRTVPGSAASLFEEIYGGGRAALPDPVAQALVALTHARSSRRHTSGAGAIIGVKSNA